MRDKQEVFRKMKTQNAKKIVEEPDAYKISCISSSPSLQNPGPSNQLFFVKR